MMCETGTLVHRNRYSPSVSGRKNCLRKRTIQSISGLGTCIGLLFLDGCKGEGIMKKIHESPNEAVIFMELAAEAMEDYHEKTDNYADAWYLLDFTFANRPYNLDDPVVHPKENFGNVWRPDECVYTYEIAVAEQENFMIRARNEKGDIEYEIEQGMEAPRKIENESIGP